MRETAFVKLFTRRALDAPTDVEGLFDALLKFPDLAPSRYGFWEPIRKVFDPGGLDEILRGWNQGFLWKGSRGVSGQVSVGTFGGRRQHASIGMWCPVGSFNVDVAVSFLREAADALDVASG
jgi:hypothetical protein